MFLKKAIYVTIVASLIVLGSCKKDTPLNQESTEATNQTDIEQPGEVGERATCTFDIKINSVTPSNAKWLLTVVKDPSPSSITYFTSNSISTKQCSTNPIQNASLNTWYTFSAPSGTGFNVKFAEFVNTLNCSSMPAGSTLTYTIRYNQNPIPTYPSSNQITKTLVWTGGVPITQHYDILSNCSAIEYTEQ